MERQDRNETDTARPTGAEGDGEEAGRAVVRALLVYRLTAAGLRPRRGLSAADHARSMDALVGHLAYMARDNVVTLAEIILTEAAKPGATGRWPSEVMVRQWAEALQKKPFRQHRIIRNWIASREGPVAEAGGYLVPLLRWLKRHQRAVMVHDLAQIRAEGADEQLRLAAMRQRISEGRPWPDDHARLEAWARDHAEALQYLDEGNLRRAAKAAGEEGDQGEVAA